MKYGKASSVSKGWGSRGGDGGDESGVGLLSTSTSSSGTGSSLIGGSSAASSAALLLLLEDNGDRHVQGPLCG